MLPCCLLYFVVAGILERYQQLYVYGARKYDNGGKMWRQVSPLAFGAGCSGSPMMRLEDGVGRGRRCPTHVCVRARSASVTAFLALGGSVKKNWRYVQSSAKVCRKRTPWVLLWTCTHDVVAVTPPASVRQCAPAPKRPHFQSTVGTAVLFPTVLSTVCRMIVIASFSFF